MSLLRTTFALLCFAAPWVIRFRNDSLPKQHNNVYWLVCLAYIWHKFIVVRGLIRPIFLEGWRSATLSSLCIAVVLMYCNGLPKKIQIKQRQENAESGIRGVSGRSKNLDKPVLLKPLLFPCRTTHTRLFPKRHSFSYSYLFVGIPVGWRGSIGSLLSADMKTLSGDDVKWWDTWFSVEAADHLERGDCVHGLREKFDSYLKKQVRYLVSFQAYIGDYNAL